VVWVGGFFTPIKIPCFTGFYTGVFLNRKLGNYCFLRSSAIACGGPAPPTSFGCSTTASSSITRKDVSLRQTYEGTAAYTFSAGGRHELKGGYQRFTILNDVASGNSTIGAVTFSYGTSIQTLIPGVTATPGALGSGVFRRTGTIGTGENLSQGVFIQDKYQIHSRLTLNLGVRFEQEDLPTFNQYPSAINFGWGDKIAPRLGFSYDLTGRGTTKIRARSSSPARGGPSRTGGTGTGPAMRYGIP